MSKKKSQGCLPIFIVAALLFSMLAGAVWYSKKQYKAKQELIKLELAALSEFDEVVTGKEIAKEIGSKYPVPEPMMTIEAIAEQAKNETEILTNKKFSIKVFTQKQAAILKKYSVAKNGDTVSFIINTTGNTITGPLIGVFNDHKGRFVMVGIHEYRFPDIMDEFLYLFNPALATKRRGEVLKEFRKKFKDGKSESQLKTQAKIIKQLYKNSGYIRDSRSWVANSEFFKNELSKREQEYKNNHVNEKKKIHDKNKLFGLINVQVVANKNKKED